MQTCPKGLALRCYFNQVAYSTVGPDTLELADVVNYSQNDYGCCHCGSKCVWLQMVSLVKSGKMRGKFTIKAHLGGN